MAKGWRVLKFGGTSVGSGESLRLVAAIVRRASRERGTLVVASACDGVTDVLAAAVEGVAAGALGPAAVIERLRRRHEAVRRALGGPGSTRQASIGIEAELARLERTLLAVARARAATPAERDLALAAGERLSLPLVTAALSAAGVRARAVDAARLVRTDAAHGAAAPDRPAIRTLAERELPPPGPGEVAVTSGFFGATAEGVVTTLGRGGSDLSAALLGEALDADRVEIWTDVDGVRSADPRVVAHSFPLPRLSHAQAEALARGGAKVLHPATMAPLAGAGIPVVVRHTRRPHGPATWVGGKPADGRGAVAVASRTADGAGTVTLVLGRESGAAVRARAADALREAGVTPLPTDTGHDDAPAVRIAVRAAQVALATRVLHDALVAPAPVVDVVVAGACGQVGRSLLRQAAERALDGVSLRVVGVLQRERAAFSADGIHPLAAEAALEEGEAVPWRRALERVRAGRARPLVLVDCTASPELAAEYGRLLAAGVAVVTPSKHGGCLPLEDYRWLHELADEHEAPFLYGASVGAGLPVLRALRELVRSGDRLHRLSAVFSGTLSFVLGRVHEGAAFSEAVEEARRLGLTEPDPSEDLSGRDVARKLLISLREAGLGLDLADVSVEALVVDDATWGRRATAARAAGRRLAYVATWDGRRARAGALEVAEDDALARTRPGENVAVLWTDRYCDVPLTIAGPGAGPDLTAANVLADLRQAAETLAAAGGGREPRRRPLGPALAPGA